MREFAESFYASKAWHDCRRAYARSVGMLCEMCLAQGMYTPGKIVHHKIHLSPDNINDASITLDWSNLMFVCQDCHAKAHKSKEKQQRYVVGEGGEIAPLVEN